MYLPKGKYCVYIPEWLTGWPLWCPPPPPRFWMTENYFRSDFSPFQINAQKFGSRNGCRRPFWMTENHFRSHFFVFTKWLTAAILDDRKSLLIAFLAISDQCATFIFLDFFFTKCHFGWPKITFNRISRHFRSIRNFFFTKWLLVAILDDRKSLCITFRAISDQYASFFPHKIAAGGHFGWPKITFDRICRHFSSIRNFYCVHKMAAGGHFESLSNAFLAITDQYATFFFFLIFFFQNGRRHFGSPIWAILDDRKSLSIAFLAISDQYTTLFFFSKWPPV